jgi:triosephosphate isomerase
MSKPLLAGNWKMHFTVEEGVEHARHLRHALGHFSDAVDLLVLPPSIMLRQVKAVLDGSPIAVGAQNAAWEDQGAFTGEISPKMLAGWCQYVLIGHSERRHIFHETDKQLNAKVRGGLANGLNVMLAVGERLEEYDAQRTDEVIGRQLDEDLKQIELPSEDALTIAYEPVWAIGTGRAATPDYANETMGLIRSLLERRFGRQGRDVRILYGGSVTPANARSLMEQPNIDGALVGGASLKVADFTQIVQASAEVAQSRV